MSQEENKEMKGEKVMTSQQAYDNWQAVITASCRVEVDAAKVSTCMEIGVPNLSCFSD
jgi:hypothetical protein